MRAHRGRRPYEDAGEAAELIRLIDLDGPNHAEAAAIVNRQVDTVTKQHSRAKKTFAELLVQVYGLQVGGER